MRKIQERSYLANPGNGVHTFSVGSWGKEMKQNKYIHTIKNIIMALLQQVVELDLFVSDKRNFLS